jgi:hypothetical protein
MTKIFKKCHLNKDRASFGVGGITLMQVICCFHKDNKPMLNFHTHFVEFMKH